MSLLRKNLKTANIGLQNSIIYKKNFLLSFLTGAFGLFVQLVFWPAFYSAGTDFSFAAINKTVIAGYYLNEMMTYSLLVYFIQRGTNMMNIGESIKDDIMNGEINIQLIRPTKYLWTKWLSSISGQIINLVLSLVLFISVLLCFRFTFIISTSYQRILFTVVFIIFGYVLSFLINGILGLLSFWLLETNSINQIVGMATAILAGTLFPIDFIQETLGSILKLLPFCYLAYIPTQIYLGKVEARQLMDSTLICIFWIIMLTLIMNRLWKSGIRRYSAFGG